MTIFVYLNLCIPLQRFPPVVSHYLEMQDPPSYKSVPQESYDLTVIWTMPPSAKQKLAIKKNEKGF